MVLTMNVTPNVLIGVRTMPHHPGVQVEHRSVTGRNTLLDTFFDNNGNDKPKWDCSCCLSWPLIICNSLPI